MNARKFKGQKILAMAVVAMFAFCAFSVCLTDNGSDAAVDQTYNGTSNIYMANGSTFTYTPTFNLSTGKITIAASGNALTSIITESGTDGVLNTAPTKNYTGTFNNGTDSGAETQLVLNATWTSTTGKLTQNASQTIIFTTFTDVALQNISKSTAIDSKFNDAGLTIATIDCYGPTNTTSALKAGSITKDGASIADSDAPFTISSNGKGVSILTKTGGLTPAHAGIYKFTIDADNNDERYVDTDSKQYTLTIYKTLEITVDNETIETYVSEGTTPTFTFSLTPVAGETATYEITDDKETKVPGSNITASETTDGTYQFDLSRATMESVFGSKTGDSVTITVTATATISYVGSDVKTESIKTADLIVYRDFAFTKNPAVDNGIVYAASGNPLDVLMSADFEGTSKISYNWGDGKSTTITTNPDSGSKYSARHIYENEGVYVITVTAYNSQGSTSLYTLYDAKNAFFEEVPAEGEDTNPDNKDDTPAEESFFDKHGYQFIIFAVIAILAFVAFFFFGIQNPVVLIAGIITALLAVLCFVYNDIGGLIEELKALLKL